jgi:dihydroorotate dehydrogenase
MYKLIIRPILFLFDPEKVHYFTFSFLKFIFKIPFVAYITRKTFSLENPKLERNLFGLKFKNPVGLGAGFDKNALMIPQLSNFGFGFIEIGTVTPKPQIGNPKKRLFRLKDDQGIINRMGFNNDGVDVVVERLKNLNPNLIVGGNIGKNTDSSTNQYTDDYLYCFNALHAHVDYFVLNVSCPNVGSMAKLQDKDYLLELISSVQKANETYKQQKPILLKIAPDLNTAQLDEIIELVAVTKIDGVIASNTSIDREGLKATKERLDIIGNGGLSGKPVADRSTKVIKYLSDTSKKSFPIIGIGGIHSSQDAIDKIAAGADLVQIYTGFIYEGPSLVKKINKRILKDS